MAYASARFGYHQPQTDSALDSKLPAFIDDDDSAVLDPSVLDADIMQSPNNISFRKTSYPHTNGVISPADSHAWDQHYPGALPGEPASTGPHIPFHEDGNGFMRQANQRTQSFVQQHPSTWAFDQGSGECTPTNQTVDFIPPSGQFEQNYQRADSAHGSFSQQHPQPQHFNVPHAEATFIPAPQVQTPMSPHSHQDWMGMAQQEMEARPSHRRMRPDSPPRTMVDLQRRDGIRKKNGRIDIPSERNIATIDDLIEKTSDEELLKELKQQKRLLRNREAALASRQRKKKHTEDLEVKEKNYAQQIAMLESQLNNLRMEHEHREQERQAVHQGLQDAQRIIESMHDEKSELVMRHNEETSSLRKRVQLLQDQLDAGPAPPMSAVTSSNGFTDFSAEMEALSMGAYDWDSTILAHELQEGHHGGFGFVPQPEPAKSGSTLEKKASAGAIVPSQRRQQESSSEQPVASGLLFMLLLCGAFVASKHPGSQPSDLPEMPDDVRAAAPTVLNNLLSESNNIASHDQAHGATRMDQEPVASGMPYNQQQHKPNRLDKMHRTITSATKQQEIDQAFSLTTTEYASLTNMDFPMYNQPPAASQGNSAPPARRNLAEALTNLEQGHRSSKAEVYTRSLLWDQIPADVVRQFKDIVRDHNEIEQRQQRQQQQQKRRQSRDYPYKHEK